MSVNTPDLLPLDDNSCTDERLSVITGNYHSFYIEYFSLVWKDLWK